MDITEINKTKLRVIKIYPETVCDGVGVRYSIYLAGCIHACVGCHNVKSWNPNLGKELNHEYLNIIINEIKDNQFLDGITLSGGDPFYCPSDLLILLKILKTHIPLNLWCYTGYRYEELQRDKTMNKCLEYIDVLVDGKFDLALRNLDLPFRGSSNQRIIYIKK